MTQEYYIISGKTRKGPYDMVALVRKIRNGSLTATTQLELGETAGAKAAQDWAELAEFFAEKKEEGATPSESGQLAQHRSLGKALQGGVAFLKDNQYSTVYSGLFILLVIMVATGVSVGVPPALRPIAFMGCFVFAHYLLSCYLFSVLRMSRGQPVDFPYLQGKIGPATKALLLSSLFASIPASVGLALLTSNLPVVVNIVGLFIFVVPGLYILALYAFTPLLILEREYGFWEAMETSRKAVAGSGFENTGVIYALFAINFIAGLCALIPMAITLPITMGALAEIYDDTFK